MSLFNTKKDREISEHSKNDVRDLKISLEFEIEAKHEYHSDDVVKITIKKNLKVNSDSSVREINKEVEGFIVDVSSEIENEINNSRHLSDGYHAKKKELED